MRRSYGRRMIAFLMAFIMALSVLFQSDIAIGGIAQVLAAQSQNVATASDAEKQSDVGDSVATLAADDAISVMVMNIVGTLPADAVMEVLVTNNAKDTTPVWEDATADVKNGANHVFTNKTAANGFAFNFKLSVERGASDTGGYISNIGGAFE